MRKNFGAKPWVYPMPVFIVAAYDNEGKANAMNAAWGGITEENEITICLEISHKTTKNIRETGAFTVSMATVSTVTESDYVGLISGNREPNKLEKAGFHIVKSEFVNAPIIEELPMTLECKVISYDEDSMILKGEIVNVSAEEKILNEKGKIDPFKLKPIVFDSVNNNYLRLGEIVGKAFKDGAKIIKK